MSDKYLIIGSLILVSIFLIWVIRDIILWYYKINERTKLQKESNDLLREVLKELKAKKNNEMPDK